MTTEHTGGCLCGAVRFRVAGVPREVDYCHCSSCRKHTGAPVSVFLNCRSAIVEFTQGERALYVSSPGVRRGFCARCGSTLSYESKDFPDEIHIPIGAMDRPEDFPPHHKPAFPDERVPWFHIAGHEE